ncbi:MAG: hypothetical protein NTY15_08720 [Planctomycetota bacterium]|nr:hypothetical protein [Planctomycetota bacterium]
MMKPPTHTIPKTLHVAVVVFGLGLLGLVSAGANPFGGLAQTKRQELVVEWDKPAATPNWLTDHYQAGPVEAKIQKTLDEELDIDFDNLSMNRIFKILRGKLDIPISIDTNAFEENKVSPDQIVMLPRIRTSVRNLLILILQPYDLTYVVESNALRITDFAGAKIVRHYDLSQVFVDNALLAELLDAIELIIAPRNWESSGGTNSISMLGSMLVINAPDEVQREVQRFLLCISKQASANLRPRSFSEPMQLQR